MNEYKLKLLKLLDESLAIKVLDLQCDYLRSKLHSFPEQFKKNAKILTTENNLLISIIMSVQSNTFSCPCYHRYFCPCYIHHILKQLKLDLFMIDQ